MTSNFSSMISATVAAIREKELNLVEDLNHLKEVERYTYLHLLEFMFNNAGTQRDSICFHKAGAINEDLILTQKHKGVLSVEERIMLLLDKALELESDLL